MTKITKTIKLGVNLPDPSYGEVSDEQKRNAFYLLGLLSTRFAEVEMRVQELIGLLMSFSSIVNHHLIENNNLETNLELIKKVNKYYKYEVEEISTLVSDIKSIKQTRNSLIHGIWNVKIDKGGTPIIAVRKNKIHHVAGTDGGGTWARGVNENFTYKNIEDMIEKLENINQRQKDINKKLKEHRPEHLF